MIDDEWRRGGRQGGVSCFWITTPKTNSLSVNRHESDQRRTAQNQPDRVRFRHTAVLPSLNRSALLVPTKYTNMKSGCLVSGVLLLCACPFQVLGWVLPSHSPATSSTAVRTTSAVRPSSVLFMSQGKSKNTEARTDNFLEFINEPMDNTVDASDVTETPELDDLAPLVRCIAGAADKRKAEDIVALRVSKVTAMTCFIVIVSGNSRPQNSAISAAIIDDVAEQFDGLQTKSGGAEGTADSGWMLLDYGDVMVHVMTPRSRLYYDVEGQWREKGGEEMDLGDVLLPNVVLNMGEGNEAAELGGGMGGVSEEDDPFWS